MAAGQPRSHLVDERAVPVLAAVHLAAFQEFAGPPPPIELLGRQEVVVEPVPLTGPRRTCRGGDAGHEVGEIRQKTAKKRRLANAGRAGDDDELAGSDIHPDVLPQVPPA